MPIAAPDARCGGRPDLSAFCRPFRTGPRWRPQRAARRPHAQDRRFAMATPGKLTVKVLKCEGEWPATRCAAAVAPPI